MFALHDTSAIRSNARLHVDRLHREARVAFRRPSLRTSYRLRLRIAGVVRRIASWIEPQGVGVRVAARHQPQYASD